MEFEYKDEKTGETKHYEISYSQVLQKKTLKSLKLNNWLLYVTIFMGLMILIVGIMILSSSVIQNTIQATVCL